MISKKRNLNSCISLYLFILYHAVLCKIVIYKNKAKNKKKEHNFKKKFFFLESLQKNVQKQDKKNIIQIPEICSNIN